MLVRIGPEHDLPVDDLLARLGQNLDLGHTSDGLHCGHQLPGVGQINVKGDDNNNDDDDDDDDNGGSHSSGAHGAVQLYNPALGTMQTHYEDVNDVPAPVPENRDTRPEMMAVEVLVPVATRPDGQSALRVINRFGEIELFGNEFHYVHGPVNSDGPQRMLASRSPERRMARTPDSMMNEAKSSDGSSVTASTIFNYRCETPGYYVKGMEEWSAPARLPGFFSRPPLRLTHERKYCNGLPPKRHGVGEEALRETILEMDQDSD